MRIHRTFALSTLLAASSVTSGAVTLTDIEHFATGGGVWNDNSVANWGIWVAPGTDPSLTVDADFLNPFDPVNTTSIPIPDGVNSYLFFKNECCGGGSNIDRIHFDIGTLDFGNTAGAYHGVADAPSANTATVSANGQTVTLLNFSWYESSVFSRDLVSPGQVRSPGGGLDHIAKVTLQVAPAGVNLGTVGTFSGGDIGEGLDLDGTFLYAVHAETTGTHTVRDATFIDRNAAAPNVTITGDSETPFGAPDYGASPDDDALEQVMNFVRYDQGANGGALQVNAAVTPGQQYKLQLLFNEACCDRGFDVYVEGDLVADQFSPNILQGGAGQVPGMVGAVITYTFTAGDTILDVDFDAVAPFGDQNPIIDAFTLEVVPEPASLGLIGLGGLALMRRRK